MTHNTTQISHFLQILIDTLNQYDYLVLRTNHLLTSHIENDVDIVIANKHKKKFIKSFCKELNSMNWFLYNRAYFSCDSYFFYNSESYDVIHIDLFNSLSYKSIIYLSHSELIKKRRILENVSVPSVEHDFCDKLFSNLLFNGKIKEKYKDDLIRFLSNYNLGVYSDIPLLKILNTFNSNDLDQIESQSSNIKSAIIKQNMFRIDFSYFKNVIKKVFKRPGAFIVVLGADGSGKSTIIDQFNKELNHYFSYEKMHYFHFCPTERYNSSENKGPVINPHSQKEYSALTTLVKLVFLSIQFYMGYFKFIFPKKMKNHYVVGDRYITDIFMDPKRYRLKNWPHLYRLVIKLLPKADIYIALTGDPEILQKRKNEVSVEEVKKYCSKLEQYFKFKKNAILVDTTKLDENESIQFIKKNMLSILRSKSN